MTRRIDETVTTSKPAPMSAEIAHKRGTIHAVDRHKRNERRRVRRQEERAWRREGAELARAA